MTENKQQSIRELALADSPEFKKKKATVELGGKKITVEFREPEAEERANIYDRSRKMIQKGKETHMIIDTISLQVNAVIALARDPSNGKSVFSKEDFDALKKKPRWWLDQWVKPALEMMGDEDMVEEEEKN